MSIVDQAVRLIRNDWGADLQPLVDELYLILTNSDLPNSGASSVSLAPPDTIPTPAGTPPANTLPFPVDGLPPWTFPALDLPALLFGDDVPSSSNPVPQSQTDPDSNQNQQKKDSTYYLTAPGKITATNDDGTYTASLYAKGLDGSGSRAIRLTEVNLDDSLSVGTFTLVSGIITIESLTTTVLNEFNAPISTNTSVKIKSEKYYCQVGGGGGGVPAKISSGGPGASYKIVLYPKGPSGAAGDTVDFTQLQIDDAETIPVDTWVMASKVGAASGKPVYVGQVPIWL